MDFTHKELVLIGERYLKNVLNCKVVIRELYSANNGCQIPDVIGFHSSQSYMIECKRSRSDFFNDRKKVAHQYPNRSMGLFKYYMVPEGLIKKEELPEDWGLIYVNTKGKYRTVKGFSWVNHLNQKNIDEKCEIAELINPQRNMQAEISLLVSALRRVAEHKLLHKIYEPYKISK